MTAPECAGGFGCPVKDPLMGQVGVVGTVLGGLPNSQCPLSSVHNAAANVFTVSRHVIPVVHEANQVIQFRGLF